MENKIMDNKVRAEQRRHRTKYSNPVVQAMLDSNNLGDCYQVQDLYTRCVESGSSSALCHTASQYLRNCSRSDKNWSFPWNLKQREDEIRCDVMVLRRLTECNHVYIFKIKQNWQNPSQDVSRLKSVANIIVE